MNYLDLSEMHCRSKALYPAAFVRDGTWDRLLATFNRIREAHGSALQVVSGYRDPVYNAKIGGAKQSQHMLGAACDVVPYNGTAAELHTLILEMHKTGKLPFLGGLGQYNTFVHFDVRKVSVLAQWKGKQVE